MAITVKILTVTANIPTRYLFTLKHLGQASLCGNVCVNYRIVIASLEPGLVENSSVIEFFEQRILKWYLPAPEIS